MMDKGIQSGYAFGPFRLDALKRCLLREGELVPLQPKDFETLLVLVRERDRVVEKEELIEVLWPDTFVEQANLSQHIYVIRKALGDATSDHPFIVTVPGRGYRFVALVTEWREENEELILAERTRTHLVIEEKEEGRVDGAMGRQGDNPFFPQRSRRLVAAGVVLLVGLTAVLAWWWMGSAPDLAETAGIKSVAVLPFKPLRADGNDEYLGLGLADSLITKLSGLRHLIVRPTGSVRKYISPEQDPLVAGREQRVDAVLDSTLQRDGERVRVTTRLLSVGDGSTLWTYQCDEQYCASLFAMQDVISEKVVEALALQLTGEERKLLKKRYTENKEAYQLYLKGRYYFANRRSVEGVQKAIEYYDQAIKLDPNYALAYAALAQAYGLGFSTSPPKERLLKARAAAMKALELDEALAEVHSTLAMVKMRNDWDWSGAEREHKRAIELNPNSGEAHGLYAVLLLNTGRFEEAIAEAQRAEEVDPISPIKNLGFILLHTRHYDQAIAEYRKVIEMNPNNTFARNRLGVAYMRKGRFEEAIAELNRALAISRGDPLDVAILGQIYAVTGQKDEALKRLDQLEDLSRRTYVTAYLRAIIYAELGEKEQAFAWLGKAYEEHSDLLVFLKMDESFDSLRADPRFADLLRRMGLKL